MEGERGMRPKGQIFAGWAMGLVALAGGVATLPAIAGKASDQRTEVIMDQRAAEFRRLPENSSDSAAVTRLAELYGPDSRAETPMQRVRLDLDTIAPDLALTRREAKATMDQARCLSEAVYYEARSESRSGQVAVAQVIMNRVRSKHFPDTICGVVYQGAERNTGCQFTFTCDGSTERQPRGVAWDRSQDVARYVMSQSPKSSVGRSTHYHTTKVNPVWAKTLKRTRTVGSHIFYRFPWRERARPVSSASLRVAPPS